MPRSKKEIMLNRAGDAAYIKTPRGTVMVSLDATGNDIELTAPLGSYLYQAARSCDLDTLWVGVYKE